MDSVDIDNMIEGLFSPYDSNDPGAAVGQINQGLQLSPPPSVSSSIPNYGNNTLSSAGRPPTSASLTNRRHSLNQTSNSTGAASTSGGIAIPAIPNNRQSVIVGNSTTGGLPVNRKRASPSMPMETNGQRSNSKFNHFYQNRQSTYQI